MANSPEGKSAANLLAILRAQSGITPAVTGLAADRVTRFLKQFTPDEEFIAGLLDGPRAHVMAVAVGEDEHQGFYTYEIPIEVWHGLEAGEDNDGADIEDMNWAIRCAINSGANWPDTLSGLKPVTMPDQRLEQDDETLTGEYLKYVITAKFRAALAGAQ